MFFFHVKSPKVQKPTENTKRFQHKCQFPYATEGKNFFHFKIFSYQYWTHVQIPKLYKHVDDLLHCLKLIKGFTQKFNKKSLNIANRKKLAKVCWHSSKTVQISLQFNEFFGQKISKFQFHEKRKTRQSLLTFQQNSSDLTSI